MSNRAEMVTQGVRIVVQSSYVPERSRPQKGMYFFSYRIKIVNEGVAPARLLTRHWIITDAQDRVEQVRGPGVVGETPRLEPGESFEYTSYCPLRTPSGTMRGSYQMVDDDERAFDVEIPLFTLSMPHNLS